MSLVNELKELSELFQSGALTAEEFAEAKEAVISEHRAKKIAESVAKTTEAPPQQEVERPSTAEAADELNDMNNRNTRQRITYNIRLEKAKASILKKGDQQYFIDCFASDFTGDFLVGATKSLEVLEKVLTNLQREPTNTDYQRLKLSNQAVKRYIIQQAGALEFLVECGAELQGEGETGYTQLFLGGVNTETALGKLGVVKQQFLEIKNFREEERRKKAENITKAAIQREARRLERNTEMERTRPGSVAKRAKTEGDEDSGDEKPNRVPIEDALKYLVGK